MHSIWLWLGCAVLGAVLFGIWRFYRLLKRIVPPGMTIRQFAKKCGEDGYLPPPPNEEAVRFMHRSSKFMARFLPGKITVVNPENLNPPGPCVITPNHGSAMDPRLFPVIMDGALRFMAARGVFTTFAPVGAMVAACGGFPANLDPGRGRAAAENAVNIVTSRQKLIMFPEGWAWLDGVVHEFKTGAVRIAKEAGARLNEPVYLVPVYIRYGKYPGKWILRFPPPVQYGIVFTLWPIFRRGVTMVVGKPIAHTELPEEAHEATEFLRKKVIELDPNPYKELRPR